jgi:hypothetical protein
VAEKVENNSTFGFSYLAEVCIAPATLHITAVSCWNRAIQHPLIELLSLEY